MESMPIGAQIVCVLSYLFFIGLFLKISVGKTTPRKQMLFSIFWPISFSIMVLYVVGWMFIILWRVIVHNNFGEAPGGGQW